jgi:DNA repair exonuclease SbcCD ATPase subunit
MQGVVKDAKFYEDNEECPTCNQTIKEDLRQSKLKLAQSKAKELQTAMDKLSVEGGEVEDSIENINTQLSEVRDMQSTINANNMAITRLQKEISALEADINKLTGSEGDLGQANKDLNSVVSERDSLGELKLRLMEEKSYSDAAGEMLKDTGIKTKVIKQYLPVMNKLVNQYLQVLDFFVSFNLDENFNEVIKSRHRDAFNYASFSEGEKQRIDLSLLFTWRQIAKMKNSTSTNLLILDETFDSSLDHDGIDNLMKILGTLEDDSNVFVISHKGDLLDGKFRSKIEFVKEHNFSKVA